MLSDLSIYFPTSSCHLSAHNVLGPVDKNTELCHDEATIIYIIVFLCFLYWESYKNTKVYTLKMTSHSSHPTP